MASRTKLKSLKNTNFSGVVVRFSYPSTLETEAGDLYKASLAYMVSTSPAELQRETLSQKKNFFFSHRFALLKDARLHPCRRVWSIPALTEGLK